MKWVLKSLHAQAMIFHLPLPLQMLKIIFFMNRGTEEETKSKQVMFSFVSIGSVSQT